MFNLDPGKLLVIAVVAIILLGPDRLPQVARQVGGAWRSFNEFRHRMESEMRNTMPDLPPTSEIARLARSPSALLNHLSSMSEEQVGDLEARPEPTPEGGASGATTGESRVESRVESPPEAGEGTADPAPPGNGKPAGPTTPRSEPSTNGSSDHATPSSTRIGDRPPRAPRPTGVVVPGDPTLN